MYIHSLNVENIKAFDKLALDFQRPGLTGAKAYPGLNFFVGGNSSGKSTLLNCIVNAVSGPTIANQQLGNTKGWLRRDSTKGLIELNVHRDEALDTFRVKGGTIALTKFYVDLLFAAEQVGLTLTLKEKS